jgi:CelD/BcsL family acetyltransferase involved in cellulose biosynthesis
VRYAYTTEKVVYIEIIDRNITVEEAQAENINAYPVGTLQLDINKDDAGLFKQMKTDCRNFIRQFERRGATLEIANPDDDFAKDYYEQLIDVFAKQGLVPTYSLEKVKCLLRNLKDSDELLCLRVRNPEGEPIATSLFLGFQKCFFFWGGASYRKQQSFRPNEYMIWTAMKYWREHGCEVFDMVGIRDYKRKFGSHEEYYAKMVFTRYPLLIKGRDLAKKFYFSMLRLKGRILHRR